MVGVHAVWSSSSNPQDAPAGIAATAYVSLVLTGYVVETTTTLVRYFNPNKKPSPDFPMISAMYTGVAFRPACKVRICGESMVTTSTQLMVSNGDAARDPNTLEFRSPAVVQGNVFATLELKRARDNKSRAPTQH